MLFGRKKQAMKEETTAESFNGDNSTEEALAAGLNTDDSQTGTSLLEDGEVPQDDPSDALRAELADSQDRYLRLAAEFDNFKRRNVRERHELIQTAGRETIQSLLEVLDDSERAVKGLETATDIAAAKEGITLVLNKLRSTLQSKGLKAMDAMGTEFDPELHEAITEIPAPSKNMVGKVVDVIAPGYYLNEKLIRHAKVIVGK
jgi:molecular chaperone GrpE